MVSAQLDTTDNDSVASVPSKISSVLDSVWSDFLIYGILVAIVVIVCIVVLVCLPKPNAFPDPDPEIDMDMFIQRQAELSDEITKAFGDCSQSHGDSVQTVIPILHYDVQKSDACPVLEGIVRQIPNVVTAGVMRVMPKVEKPPAHGYADHSNITIRYFYCVKTAVANRSGIWVDGARKFFREGEYFCADVSRENYLFNSYKYEPTLVIFIDLPRPENMARGISTNTNAASDEIYAAVIAANAQNPVGIASNSGKECTESRREPGTESHREPGSVPQENLS